jgi:hypothetical protein
MPRAMGFSKVSGSCGHVWYGQIGHEPRPALLRRFLEGVPAANQFSSNYQRLYVNGQLGEAGQGRIMDPSSDVADWMVAHRNATEMCLVSQKLEQDTTVQGAVSQRRSRTVFVLNTRLKRMKPSSSTRRFACAYQTLVLKQGREVLAVVDHTAANRTVIRLDMLLMCAQLPHGSTGIPIGYWVDDQRRAHTLFTFTDSSYGNWHQILINKKACCVMQLLGLTQFRMIPRWCIPCAVSLATANCFAIQKSNKFYDIRCHILSMTKRDN